MLSNFTNISSYTSKIETLQDTNDTLKHRIEDLTSELENRKCSSATLHDLYNSVVQRCKNLEENGDIQNVNFFKAKIEKITKELEDVNEQKNLIENQHLVLKTTNDNLHKEKNNMIKKFDLKILDITEKLNSLEEEKFERNNYQKQLEESIEKFQKALTRKDQYIKQKEFEIENLMKEKRILEKSVAVETYKNEEFDTYQSQIANLASSILQMKNAFVITESAYNKEIKEIKDELKNRDKLIATRNEVIRQQDRALQLMKGMNGSKEIGNFLYQEVTDDLHKWQNLFSDN